MIFDIHANTKSISSKDLEKLKEIDEEGLNTFLSDPFTFNICIAYEGNKILGFGLIRVINEFKMSLNDKIGNFKKAKVIKELLSRASELSQCNEVIIEITKGGQHYIDSLIKHYNFYESSGTVLRLEK